MPLTPLRQKGPLQTHAIVIPSQLRGMKYSREMETQLLPKNNARKELGRSKTLSTKKGGGG